MKPNPLNRPGTRNALCPQYDDCLDHAVNLYWLHFDCSECAHKSEKKALRHESGRLSVAFDIESGRSAYSDWM